MIAVAALLVDLLLAWPIRLVGWLDRRHLG
jgi:hypothetical protein